MKKISLNVAALDGTEILSRDQLKSVLGGSGSSLPCSVYQECPNPIPGTGGKTTLGITDCYGVCSSDASYVKCVGPTNILVKFCDGTTTS